MPSALPVVSRRRMLVGTAALAVVGVTGVACAESSPPPELADLMTQLDMARSDSQLASDAASAAKPPQRPALAAVSSERSKHAEALADEIARLTRQPTSTSAKATSTAAQASPPTAKDVVAALQKSAESAGRLATVMSGYRAGLLGSIAASCTAAYTVALGSRAGAP
ncbi:hypothetical protein [Mycolicibacterium sp. 120270]|uniref:hypothetical protein n=1 Tax=Mycolicibacterium sp. 120270 TaxID=3090600 RepID=UPI00299E0407|nr:hypothetical protein [Mycolicibacterium sp. 120270]MDX1886958.1 hypothetical protein [Mycolicibacterium sp. 120270]